MARASMADLITRLRLLINDLAGAEQVFSDDELEDALDARRADCRHLELAAAQTWDPVTGVTYLDHYAKVGDWETDAALEDATGLTLVTATADYLVGHWTFAASQTPPVYLTGKTYDLYATAADVLEMWAAKVALAFDFEADGASYKVSQRRAALLDLAGVYRRRARGGLGIGGMTIVERSDAY
jgi:hypothetical protein